MGAGDGCVATVTLSVPPHSSGGMCCYGDIECTLHSSGGRDVCVATVTLSVPCTAVGAGDGCVATVTLSVPPHSSGGRGCMRC